MKRVLITGINGMLGRYIYRQLSANSTIKIYGTGRSNSVFSDLEDYFQGDLCDNDFINLLSKIEYDAIVHCAALVNLNTCEADYHLAEAIHVTASENLAKANPNSIFLYISTDSIFNGTSIRRTEVDGAEPLNNYALTKYLGGKAVRENHTKVYDLRLNVYGFKEPFGSSLFEWAYQSMSNNQPINGYDNVTFNPLYAGQIAEVIEYFIKEKPKFGIYNLGCNHGLSKYEFVMKMAKVFNLDKSLITKFSANFEKATIKRPYHTLLSTHKLRSTFPNLDLRLERGFEMLKNDLATDYTDYNDYPCNLWHYNKKMNTINLTNRIIGDGQPLYFIADIGANHDGSLERAYRLIELAKEAGADAAKFQNFKAKKIVSKEGFENLGGQLSHQAKWKKSVFEVYEDASVSDDWTALLKAKCDEIGIDYFTSAYDFDSVDHAFPFVNVYKIGSGDVTWLEIIEYTAKKGKPVMIATGAADMQDVERAMKTLQDNTNDIVLMQCNTNYTVDADKYKYVNLNVLHDYKKRFPNVVLGLSDHTFGHATVLGAVALGATVFEKHFTDDNGREGPDHKFAMNPTTWREMVDNANQLYAAMGDGIKRVEENEKKSLVVQQRSLRATKDLKAGKMIVKTDLEALRPIPADGLQPYRIDELLGKILKKDLSKGNHITLEHI